MSEDTHRWRRPDTIVPVANRLPPPQRRKKPGATDEHQRSVGAIVKLAELSLALAEFAIQSLDRELQRGASPQERFKLDTDRVVIRGFADKVKGMFEVAKQPRRW